MSTKLTKNKVSMVESQSLQLVLKAAKVQEIISLYLSDSLKRKGYHYATPSILTFLSTLECGINYGSEVARELGVSRQMVAKIVKELCNANYLEQQEGLGKQKQIIFTKTGELLMSDARRLLADVDKVLNQRIGETTLTTMVTQLECVQKSITELSDKE